MDSEMENIPLTEFDPDRDAIIDPSKHIRYKELSEYCVIPYYGTVKENLVSEGILEKVHEVGSILMPVDIYKLHHDGKDITVVFPTACGAPLAAVFMEQLIGFGCRKFIACGSAGVLNSELGKDEIIIPNGAVRDEGTSYHYLPPSRTIEADSTVLRKLEAVLQKHHITYETGLTWTTDAPFRETKTKIARRNAEGCLTVEMEYASFLAVAIFRNVKFGQYLLVGDDVSGDEWDHRNWADTSPAHDKLFWLSVEACLTL
ncbi:nucleoside phosphorylase [Chloroflexota bacterium]